MLQVLCKEKKIDLVGVQSNFQRFLTHAMPYEQRISDFSSFQEPGSTFLAVSSSSRFSSPEPSTLRSQHINSSHDWNLYVRKIKSLQRSVINYPSKQSVKSPSDCGSEIRRMALSRRDFSSSSIYDPLFDFRPSSLMPRMWDALSVFDDFPSRSFARDTHAMASTRVDWKETDTEHIFKADLPGLKKEEINVQLHGDRVLEISGERSKEEEKKSDTWHSVERSSGKFLRRFRLPENVETDKLAARVENGVLTVTVPKARRQLLKFVPST